MLSILPIVYLAVLAGCAVAVLLTAIIFLIKKKAGKSLALYAVCVLALLGLGFLESIYNPVPNTRHTEPQPVVVSPGSQDPATPWAITPQPAPVVETDSVDAELDPEETEQGTDVPGSDIEPSSEETSAETSNETASPVTISTSSSTATASPSKTAVSSSRAPESSANAGSQSEPPQTNESSTTPGSTVNTGTSTERSVLSLSESPTLASDPALGSIDNPLLAPEPTLATMSNPMPLYDPPLSEEPETANPQDSSQNVTFSPANENSEISNGNSSATYIHDFSNGRVLITKASDNNGDPVYHIKDCRAAKTIPPENEAWLDSEEAARKDGRRLCGYCRR